MIKLFLFLRKEKFFIFSLRKKFKTSLKKKNNILNFKITIKNLNHIYIILLYNLKNTKFNSLPIKFLKQDHKTF